MTPGSHPETASIPVHYGQQAYVEEALRPKHGQTHGISSRSTTQATASTPASGFQSPFDNTDCVNHPVNTSAPLMTVSHQTNIAQFQSRNANPNVVPMQYGEHSAFATQVCTLPTTTEPCFNCGIYGHWAQFCLQPRKAMSIGFTQARSVPSITMPSIPVGAVQQPLGLDYRTDFNIDLSQQPRGANSMLCKAAFHHAQGLMQDHTIPLQTTPLMNYGLPTPISPTNSQFRVFQNTLTSDQVRYSIHHHGLDPHFPSPCQADFNGASQVAGYAEQDTIIYGQDTLPQDVMALAHADIMYESQTNRPLPSCTIKPLASTMEVADLEAPLQLKSVDDLISVSKYFGTFDIGTFNKNISETPMWHMYQSDPAFSQISSYGESISLLELVARREAMISGNQSATNGRGARESSTQILTSVESDETRRIREQEEKLERLGVTGSPKPVLPFHPAGYNSSTPPLGPYTSSSLMMQHSQGGRHNSQQLYLKSCDDVKHEYPTPRFSGTISISPHPQQHSSTPLPFAPSIQQDQLSHSVESLSRRQRRSLQHVLNSSLKAAGPKETQSDPHQATAGAKRKSKWRKRTRSRRPSNSVLIEPNTNPVTEPMQGHPSSKPSTSISDVVIGTATNHSRSSQDHGRLLASVSEHDHTFAKRPRYENKA